MPTGRMMSSGWKLPSTMEFQVQRKKLAYLKYINTESDTAIEPHMQASCCQRFVSLTSSFDSDQSINDVATSIRKNHPDDLK